MASNVTDSPTVKLIVVGRGSVGKSALTLQFMYEEFIESYEPTKSDSYVKRFKLDGKQTVVSILDTAGQESYAGLDDECYRSSDGFLIVFSLIDEESFKAVNEYIAKSNFFKGDDGIRIPRILVGNKVDLVGNKREIPEENIRQLVQNLKIAYYETSAKNNYNVSTVFEELTREVLRKKQPTNVTVVNQKQVGEDGCCNLL